MFSFLWTKVAYSQKRKQRRYSQAVRRRSATPWSPVQIRVAPPVARRLLICSQQTGSIFFYDYFPKIFFVTITQPAGRAANTLPILRERIIMVFIPKVFLVTITQANLLFCRRKIRGFCLWFRENPDGFLPNPLSFRKRKANTNSWLKVDKRFARMIFARQGGGRRKADALQGRQRSIAKIRPQRLSTFSQELVWIQHPLALPDPAQPRCNVWLSQ